MLHEFAIISSKKEKMPALDQLLSAKIKRLEEANLLRNIKTTEHIDAIRVIRGNKEFISFCSNDYLGLSYDKRLIEASIKATQKYGAGSGASRLVTGSGPLFDELEELLAKKNNTESCCVFGSGYLTNLGVIPALISNNDLIILDKLSHSCMHSGAKLSKASYKIFSYNRLSNLSNILEKNRNKYSNCIVATETIFSMDGDKAPLEDLIEITRKYDCWLMTDDAHGFGVIEKSASADIQMGTLSKAAGSYGGYVCGSKVLIDYLKTTARSLIYSTALPPGVVAASIEAVKIIMQDKELCKKPLRKAKIFTSLLGIKEAESAIVPLVLGDETVALKASADLEKDGFLVTAIRPPTVPAGTARLRFTFSALHKESDIEKLVSLIKKSSWANAII